ncbi:MAG: hypothetical protein KDD11_03440 [Acidobacteria bacterium]|nr:hypothetical protein [Acidobacteriota bacterium]
MSAELATIISGIVLLLVFGLAGWRAARRRVVPTGGETRSGDEPTTPPRDDSGAREP